MMVEKNGIVECGVGLYSQPLLALPFNPQNHSLNLGGIKIHGTIVCFLAVVSN